jgi:hypothetical protein
MNAEKLRFNMKTLLRKIPSGLYFQGPDRWTHNPVDGFNFKSIDRALQFIETWGLKDVELAFAFNKPDSVTRVPLEKIAFRYAEK